MRDLSEEIPGPKLARAIREALGGGIADSVRISKDGTIRARHGFFYRHGGSAERFQARVEAALDQAQIDVVEIIEASEHWHPWPRDSYWQVQLKAKWRVSSMEY